jgi:phytoene synthase
MESEGIDADSFLGDPRPGPELARIVERLLAEARRLYFRAEAGIPALPSLSRPSVYAARLIYAEIGSRIEANGHDSVNVRAVTSRRRKAGLALTAVVRSLAAGLMPQSAVLHAPPLPETRFLVEAAARRDPAPALDRHIDQITGIFAALKQQDAERMRSARLRI